MSCGWPDLNLEPETADAIGKLGCAEYRNPAQLPSGAVLVVGSGASGTQIAEELHRSGRKVFLAVVAPETVGNGGLAAVD